MNTLEAGNALTINNVTLIPIQRVSLHTEAMNSFRWVIAQKEPYAIILRDSKGERAFDMQGNHISIESLMQHLPVLTVTTLCDSSLR